MIVDVIPVGHPARKAAGRALWLCLVLAATFTAFAWVSTQIAAVRAGSPWQDDPYNGVVSFTEFLVPSLTCLAVVRAALWRRDSPQPVFRINQLLRAGLATTVLVAVTVLTDAMAVVLGADRLLWGATTPWLIAALGVLGAAVLGVLLELRRGFAALPTRSSRRPDGDWLDDLPAVLPDRLIRLRRVLHVSVEIVRRHVAAGAVAVSLLAGMAQTAAQAISEGVTSPVLVLAYITVLTGGYLAFCLVASRVLQVVVERDGTGAAPRGAARAAILAGGVALPAAVVLRDPIAAALGTGPVESPVALATLVVAVSLPIAAMAFGVTLARSSLDQS
jgi:hypothetical protein